MSFIYHIATAEDWARARADGQYRTSTRGVTIAEQGFIHCSTAAQVGPAANLYYKGLPDLLVLVIDTGRVQHEIRFEHAPGSDELFPHIYGPLNADAVVQTSRLAPGRDGQFSFDAREG